MDEFSRLNLSGHEDGHHHHNHQQQHAGGVAGVSMLSTSAAANARGAAAQSHQQLMAVRAADLERLQRERSDSPEIPPKKACNFLTPDVIEATIQCMVAQADECQKNNLDEAQAEFLILEEFGRCLVEIIDFSTMNPDRESAEE